MVLFDLFFCPLAGRFLDKTISKNQKEVAPGFIYHIRMDCKAFIQTYVGRKEKLLHDWSEAELRESRCAFFR